MNKTMIPTVIAKYILARQVLKYIFLRMPLDRFPNKSAETPNCSLLSFNSFKLEPRSTTRSIFDLIPSTTSSTWSFNLVSLLFESLFISTTEWSSSKWSSLSSSLFKSDCLIYQQEIYFFLNHIFRRLL